MRTVRTVVDVLAYGALCFAGGMAVTAYWLFGERRK